MNTYKSYAEYLRTPAYLKVRDAVMRRSGGRCECNLSTHEIDGPCPIPATEVHHLRYPPWGTVDVAENLIAVCHGCHEQLHTCESCGGRLKAEAIKAGRTICVECYCDSQD